jgi:hypothetical protein
MVDSNGMNIHTLLPHSIQFHSLPSNVYNHALQSSIQIHHNFEKWLLWLKNCVNYVNKWIFCSSCQLPLLLRNKLNGYSTKIIFPHRSTEQCESHWNRKHFPTTNLLIDSNQNLQLTMTWGSSTEQRIFTHTSAQPSTVSNLTPESPPPHKIVHTRQCNHHYCCCPKTWQPCKDFFLRGNSSEQTLPFYTTQFIVTFLTCPLSKVHFWNGNVNGIGFHLLQILVMKNTVHCENL